MNILLVNHYAGAPTFGMEYRPWYLAKEWQLAGHNVLIVASSFTHLKSKQYLVQKKAEIQNIDGVNYLILKTTPYEINDIKRVLNILAFLFRLLTSAKSIISRFKPDIVVSSSTYVFDIFPCSMIAKRYKAKLVFEVHDLWPLSPVELGGYSKWHPYIMLMQYAENYAYKYSDKVVSILPNTLDYMVIHGLKPKKFVYIPNGVNAQDWDISLQLPDGIHQLIQNLKAQKRTIIGYAGSHGIANALHSLLSAMKALEKENVALLLIGTGQEKENLINYSKQLNLTSTYFLPAINRSLIPSFLDKMDILYIGLQNQPVFNYGISPNKLLDYMIAGKPIIQAIKAGNDIVSNAECGITIEPENVASIIESVRTLRRLPIAELNLMGLKGRDYCLRNHNYQNLALKFINSI